MSTRHIFNQIYDATWDRVQRYLVPRVRSKADLEDLCQEVYLELYRALDQSRAPMNAEAFVIHIAKQKLAGYYQTEAARPTLLDDDSTYDAHALDQWLDQSLEDTQLTQMMSAQILTSLPNHPWPTRQIFTCIFSLGMKMPEIADALGLTVTQVRNHYYRTLAQLKERFQAKDM